MTNIEKVNKALENANEDKIKEVLDFLGYKEDGKFIPKYEERYYFIHGGGFVNFNYWVDDRVDNHTLLMNNIYRTEEEAEQALDFQTRKAKLIKEIEDSSDVIDWSDDSQYKHYLYYNYRMNEVIYHYNEMHKSSGVTYTTNKPFLKELIKERSDEVKELLFGIKL